MTTTETKVDNLKINRLTKAQYDGITPSSDELYYFTDLSSILDNPKILINVTYSELVTLKSNSQLKTGAYYRITDYVTTTNGSGTATYSTMRYSNTSLPASEASRSAGHQFDIIIQALGTSNLAEIGTCALHSGDTYFSSCNLGAWRVWYDINNDTTKYAWADTTNGKGVIYRMIDEHYNDLPYDFKNIQFYRDKTNTRYSNISTHLVASDNYYFTFSYATSTSATSITDYSISSYAKSACMYNSAEKVGLWTSNPRYAIGLNNIVYLFVDGLGGGYCTDNKFGADAFQNTFCGTIMSNKFLRLTQGNITKHNVYDNIINSACVGNTINGTFGGNVINGAFQFNNILNGTFSQNNTNSFMYNTITLNSKSFMRNNIKYNFSNNTITLSSSNFEYNIIGENVQYISSSELTNTTIENGVQGTSSNLLSLSGISTSSGNSITIKKDTNGKILVVWLDLDVIKGLYKSAITDATWTTLPTSFQPTLVSGTNIKTINNTSILGSGNISISGGTATDVQINGTSITSSGVANIVTNTAYNASSNKIATMSDVPDVSNYLTNTATGTGSLIIGGTASDRVGATSVGYISVASANNTTAIGYNSQATSQYSITIGRNSKTSGASAIQIGYGTNSTANTLSIGFYNNSSTHYNWQLLDGTTGKIPTARIDTDTTATSGSAKPITSGAVYTIVGNIESALNTINSGSNS